MSRMHAGIFIYSFKNTFSENATAARKNARPEINASQSGVCFYKPGWISVAGRPGTGGEVRHIFSIIVGWIFFNTARTISTQPHVDQGNYLECRGFVEIKFNELVLHFSPVNNWACGVFFNKNFLAVEMNCD